MFGSATCACTFPFSEAIEGICTCENVAIGLAIFGILSNVLIMVTLKRVRMETSTKILLLAITFADFTIPIIHLTRHFYIEYHAPSAADISLFRITLFYLWHVMSAISVLLTLVLAGRRLMAIQYPHTYQTIYNRRLTNWVLAIVCAFSIIVLHPILSYQILENGRRSCVPDPRREILYVSLTMITLTPRKNYPLKFSYWFYVFGFNLVCPLILALLSIRFVVALRKRLSSSSVSNPQLLEAKAKMKLILIVSLLALLRNVPIGLISAAFLVFEPSPPCLTLVRLLTKESTILLSALNFFVFYYTNERLKNAVPSYRPAKEGNGWQELVDLNGTDKTDMRSTDSATR